MNENTIDVRTLPEWCATLGLNLETARRVLRVRPDIAKFGRRCGSAKVYTRSEAEHIRDVVRSARKPEPAAVG